MRRTPAVRSTRICATEALDAAVGRAGKNRIIDCVEADVEIRVVEGDHDDTIAVATVACGHIQRIGAAIGPRGTRERRWDCLLPRSEVVPVGQRPVGRAVECDDLRAYHRLERDQVPAMPWQ